MRLTVCPTRDTLATVLGFEISITPLRTLLSFKIALGLLVPATTQPSPSIITHEYLQDI